MNDSIDFNQLLKQADAAGFTLVPDGPYDVIVTKAEVKPTSTGKKMIKVQAEVEGGPHNKRKLFTQHVLSPDNDNALRFFFEHMAGYGIGREYWAQPGASLEAAAAAIIGRPAVFEVGHKAYQGSDRNEVTKVLPRGASAGITVPGPGVPGVAAPAVVVPPVAVPQPVSGVPAVPQPPASAPTSDEEPF